MYKRQVHMMVKALLFDNAREIEDLLALQIDWDGCGVSEMCIRDRRIGCPINTKGIF